jgi:hypothetical protein
MAAASGHGEIELALAWAVTRGADFADGVRAMLVDKAAAMEFVSASAQGLLDRDSICHPFGRVGHPLGWLVECVTEWRRSASIGLGICSIVRRSWGNWERPPGGASALHAQGQRGLRSGGRPFPAQTRSVSASRGRFDGADAVDRAPFSTAHRLKGQSV